MGLELFWVTHPIRSVIPSCLPDELWESASNVCTKDRLGNAIFFLRAVASMAALLPPRGPASDKCSSLFSVSCFPPRTAGANVTQADAKRSSFSKYPHYKLLVCARYAVKRGIQLVIHVWLYCRVKPWKTGNWLFPLAVDELTFLFFCVTFYVTNT